MVYYTTRIHKSLENDLVNRSEDMYININTFNHEGDYLMIQLQSEIVEDIFEVVNSFGLTDLDIDEFMDYECQFSK